MHKCNVAECQAARVHHLLQAGPGGGASEFGGTPEEVPNPFLHRARFLGGLRSAQTLPGNVHSIFLNILTANFTLFFLISQPGGIRGVDGVVEVIQDG
jgi:hypothetical protein